MVAAKSSSSIVTSKESSSDSSSFSRSVSSRFFSCRIVCIILRIGSGSLVSSTSTFSTPTSATLSSARRSSKSMLPSTRESAISRSRDSRWLSFTKTDSKVEVRCLARLLSGESPTSKARLRTSSRGVTSNRDCNEGWNCCLASSLSRHSSVRQRLLGISRSHSDLIPSWSTTKPYRWRLFSYTKSTSYSLEAVLIVPSRAKGARCMYFEACQVVAVFSIAAKK